MYLIKCKCIKDCEFLGLKEGKTTAANVLLNSAGETVIHVTDRPTLDKNPLKCTWEWFIEYFELIA